MDRLVRIEYSHYFTSTKYIVQERQRRSCLEKFNRATADYQPQIDQTISSAQHKFADILLELKKAQKKIRDEAQQIASPEAEDAMIQCRELLMHFWSW